MITVLIHRVHPICRVAASIALLAVFTAAQPRPQPQKSVSGTGPSVAAVTIVHSDYYPVVHLRKLHLVRPDLIPYPVYYAVYC